MMLCAWAVKAQERSAVTAHNAFEFSLPERPDATTLLPQSPFGINTAVHPDSPNLEAQLRAMNRAGIKWGRQDFTWRRIEREKGRYDWAPYDRLVAQFREHGILIFGNLAYEPDFYDTRSEEGVRAYARFAGQAAARYAGQVDHWQIWNEPNLGFHGGDPDAYARLLSASGRAIHEAHPQAKVLGLNMAFCDVLWAEQILQRVPEECLDIVCFHPYRNPNAPEDSMDWWVLDQYVKRFHKDDLQADYPLAHMTFLEQTDQLIQVMSRYGRPKPLWVTEICFNTHIHPYGVPELRQADLAVRFYLLAIASRNIEKVFWWTLRDRGWRQFDAADMVGLMRPDLTPKYAYHAYAFMTAMLETSAWVRNDAFGPDLYAAVFTYPDSGKDLVVAWTPKPFAYIRVNCTEAGLALYDVYGTRRDVTYHPVRTKSLPVALSPSPVYIVGPKGLRAQPRPDPGW